MRQKIIHVYLVSDSVGDTVFNLAKAVMAQYPEAKAVYERFPFVNSQEKISQVLKGARREGGLIFHTIVALGIADKLEQQARALDIPTVDLMSQALKTTSQVLALQPTHESGALHHLNEKYFDRISAMEFAVLYDDGKNPKGFLEADVVLLGVSRTSKTPLSLFLANKNIKVANLPLVPQAHIPEELYRVDPHKLVGLTNDPKLLNTIRRQRMLTYGLNPDTTYSDMGKINEELAFAQDLYQKLGCYVINVANRSIEETATLIIEKLGLDDLTH